MHLTTADLTALDADHLTPEACRRVRRQVIAAELSRMRERVVDDDVLTDWLGEVLSALDVLPDRHVTGDELDAIAWTPGQSQRVRSGPEACTPIELPEGFGQAVLVGVDPAVGHDRTVETTFVRGLRQIVLCLQPTGGEGGPCCMRRHGHDGPCDPCGDRRDGLGSLDGHCVDRGCRDWHPGDRCALPIGETCTLRDAQRVEHRQVDTGAGVAPLPDLPTMRSRLLAYDVGCVRESGGRWYLCNHRAKGWGSSVYWYPSREELLARWEVELGPELHDEHGTYWPLIDPRTRVPGVVPTNAPEASTPIAVPPGAVLSLDQASPCDGRR